MADNMNYLYTIGGYATLFGLGYVIYQVSTQKGRKRAVAAQTKTTPKASQPEPRKEDRKKKQRMENFASEAQESSSKAPKTTAKAPESAWLSNVDSSDDVDNREFARQLAKAKEGTKLAAKTDAGKQREKSVKQSRANKISTRAEEKESAPSSTTGADADDDQSPAVSPDVGPAEAGDISDMLEPTRSGPSVLRLTDTAPKKQNKKPTKTPEPVESKKQRQNRKKAEAAKEARLEAEKDRKALEEKQRRQARIADGRSAKDGSQYTAAAVKSSSWNQGAPSVKTAPAATTNGFHAPLDTFEESTPSAAKSVTAPKSAGDHWTASLPSEEEQIELLKSEDDDWSTVKIKSKKTSKKESSIDSGDEPSQIRPAAQPKQPVAGKTSKPPQSFGSFSALSSKDEPVDEEEEEEEWDV